MILSIVCTAYNHEKYIRKTLEGFVKQKTDYKYKVIVHDDASTDKTRDIIDEFVKKYPDLFVAIYQQENQYSKGVDIYKKFIQPLIDTKYTAICEGDDYWCTEDKLQRQIDYLEKHPNCSMCVHNTSFISEYGVLLNKNINNLGYSLNFNTSDVITNRYFHTSSYVYRTELAKTFPKEFYMQGAGDYPLTIYLSLFGEIHYIDKIMSCYRVGSVNSWTQRVMKNDEKAIEHNNSAISALKKMNLYTNFKYNDAFKKQITYYRYQNILLHKSYWKIFTNISLFILFLKKCIPQIFKNKIKGYVLSKR